LPIEEGGDPSMEILQIWNSVRNMITYTQDEPAEAPYWNGGEEEEEEEEEEIIDLCDE
jgi:hypothetical protein